MMKSDAFSYMDREFPGSILVSAHSRKYLDSYINLLRYEEERTKKIEAVERYGFGRIIRDFFRIPYFFPLPMKAQHGICLWEDIPPSELRSSRKFMLVFNKRWFSTWKKKVPQKKSFVIPNPFLLWKKMSGESHSPDAQGSVFFYAHSTAWHEAENPDASIIKYLKSLPSEFMPCVISMHYIDFIKGKHEFFLNNGFDVFCAGHGASKFFAKDFYQMLSRRKYALSNDVGSHYFYAIEHGLPFSYIGNEPSYSNSSYSEGDWAAVLQAQQHVNSKFKISCGLCTVITDDQRDFVKSEMGFDVSVNKLFFWKMLILCYLWEVALFLLRKFCSLIKLVCGQKALGESGE